MKGGDDEIKEKCPHITPLKGAAAACGGCNKELKKKILSTEERRI